MSDRAYPILTLGLCKSLATSIDEIGSYAISDLDRAREILESKRINKAEIQELTSIVIKVAKAIQSIQSISRRIN